MKTFIYPIIFSLLLVFSPVFLSAQNIDSIHIGPGVVYYHEQMPEVPLNFDILKIDLSNPDIHMETVKGMDKLLFLERTSSMSARYDKEGTGL